MLYWQDFVYKVTVLRLSRFFQTVDFNKHIKGVEVRMNKKTKIYLLVLIWAAVLLQLFINASINREEKMVEQVMSEGVSSISEGSVRAYSYYGNDELDAGARRVMAVNLAGKLGIESGYEINERSEKRSSVTELKKYGEQGDTIIKIITLDEHDDYGQPIKENYIMIDIILKKAAGFATYEYKNVLNELYKDLGMKASTNVYVCTQMKGRLSEDELQRETDNFLEDMNAVSVCKVEFDDVICIYGYSKNIDEYVYQDSNKVNVNIAFSYDSVEDITYVHRAVPFIDKSF